MGFAFLSSRFHANYSFNSNAFPTLLPGEVMHVYIYIYGNASMGFVLALLCLVCSSKQLAIDKKTTNTGDKSNEGQKI